MKNIYGKEKKTNKSNVQNECGKKYKEDDIYENRNKR